MATVEELLFNILAKDNASAAFIKAGKSAKDAAGNVQSLNDRLTEIAKRSVEARVGLKGDKEAGTSIDSLQAKLISLGEKTANPNITVEGALRAQEQIVKLELELDKLEAKSEAAKVAIGAGGLGGELDKTGKSADDLGGKISTLAGSTAGAGGSGMGALIGVGVALSPILVTLGTGLGGLGVAAYGLAKPIENAAQATGGLAKNMSSLDQEQQVVAKGILGLGTTFGAFQKAVQPEVMAVFTQGLQLAGSVLKDIEPVTEATGKAFAEFLGQINQTFQSGQFQNFFKFMGATAGPDMQALGGLFIALLKDIPPLVEGLQPLALGLLHLTTGVADLVGGLAKLHLAIPLVGAAIGFMVAGPLGALIGAAAAGAISLGALKDQASTVQPVFDRVNKTMGDTGKTIVQVTPAVTRFGTSAGQVVRPLTDVATAAAAVVPKFAAVNEAIAAMVASFADVPPKAAPATDEITRMAAANEAAFKAAGPATDQITRLATSTKDAAGHVAPLTDAITMTAKASDAAFKAAGPATDEITRLAQAAEQAGKSGASAADGAAKAAPKITEEGSAAGAAATQIHALVTATDAYISNVSALVGGTNNVITVIRQMGKDAKTTGASFTGLNGNSITLQNDLSQNLIPSLQGVVDKMQQGGANAQDLAKVISSDLKPAVDAGALANKGLRDEIFAMAQEAGFTGPNKIGPLTGFIDKNAGSLNNARNAANSYAGALGNIPKNISTAIHVTAQAQIAVSTGIQRQLPRAATGMMITAGTGPTADDVLIRASRGELIVPSHMVKGGAVDHLKGRIPGFASGGMVGSYSGSSLPELTTWVGSADRTIAQAIAAAVSKGVQSAISAASVAPGGSPALPGGGAPAANAALARQMMPAWASGAEWNAWNAVAMAESGWNNLIRNASSGAYGIPQALPPSKMGAAANPPQSNPGAQIAWMIQYIRSVYGDPIGAAAHENAFHWYGSGFHGTVNGPTLFGAGERGRERVDITPGGQAQPIVLEFRSGGGSDLERALIGIVQKYVIVHGGDAQAALGQRA